MTPKFSHSIINHNDMANDSFYIFPQPGYVVVKLYKETEIKPQQNAKGAFTVADTMSSKDSAGEVVAVGDNFIFYEGNNAVEVKAPVKIGDVIIYRNFGADKYLDFKTGEHLTFVKFHLDPKYNEIMGVINK